MIRFKTINYRVSFAVVVLLIAVFGLYTPSLHAPFVFDDFTFFASPENLAKYGDWHFKFSLRWLPNVTLVQQTHWTHLEIFWLRLGNVSLHAVNAITLFFLLRQLFRITLLSSGKYKSDTLIWLAFFGALLFALHPVAIYGVTYLIQRSILMATLFVLLMLLCFLRGLEQGKWGWMIVAALFYFAAVFSKEHSVTAPMLALALTCLVRKPCWASLKPTIIFFVLCIPVAVSIILAMQGIIGAAYEPHATGIVHMAEQKQGVSALPSVFSLSILTQSLLFFKYLGLWLLPNPAWMSVDMRESFALSWFDPAYLAGLMMFMAYAGLAIWLLLKRGKKGLLGFALLFPWVLFLPELSTVRVQEPFVLYRSYLWAPGLFVALPVMLSDPVRKWVWGGLIAWAVILIPLSLNRLETFSSTLLLWDDAEKLVHGKQHVLGVERIYTNRGNKLFQFKRYDEAIADFTKSIEAYPGDELVYGSRAKAYYFIGKFPEALADFDRAIALKSDSRRLYYDRSLVHRALGNEAAAQADLRQSCLLGGVCP